MAEDKECTPAVDEDIQTAADEKLAASGEGDSVEKDPAEMDDLSQEEMQVISLQERNEKLEAEKAELKDQLLRKQADFDNFRKRMFREKDEAIKYANSSLLSDLVSVIDDFERAITSAESSTDFDGFLSGVKLIEKQFVGMLERDWGLKRMETVGKEFDPQEHEALMMEECDTCTAQTVIEDYQKGYFLHDRVLRHAKVKIGVPPAPAETGKKGKKQTSAGK